MKTSRAVLGAIAVLGVTLGLIAGGVALGQAKDASTRVYELRTYTTLPGRLPALNKRFSDHTVKLFDKHGLKSVMYWIPTDEARKDNTLIYVLVHESQDAADRNWKAFQSDTDWIKVREASEVDGKILAKPPERVFMRMTDYSPAR